MFHIPLDSSSPTLASHPKVSPQYVKRESDGSSTSFNKALLRGLVCISHRPGQPEVCLTTGRSSITLCQAWKKADTAKISGKEVI
ncbi:hypothetical protein PBY51_019325 [Eleginops maclovinus]|uniref:Uncharacterized protein n=1 Tax=Eleginops maclovinus TaxID=56733 RepID=A0AAN8AVN2_ELEMC|nr:hypothetical protein PBY51_019325 [Eleginops maclovinus]